ncbi:MAG: protein-disulfide reductase DsbD domain-containing protein [Hoeflea sp.]|uniref:protein-disulfide reductase DsbD domain-containing protein n=1 Tax=Hoeflea sp. TaxID=1940281 RepID=UPI003296999D
MSKHYSRTSSRQSVLLIASAAFAFILSSSPALSLDSGWTETQGGRMRLVVDPAPREDGTIAGILDIGLDPGWKTYWRDPGSAGIPPTLDFSKSQGVTLETMQYPPPVRVDDGYAIWAGYTAPVQLPLILKRTASGDARIHATAFIGICEKICVPFQAEFEIDLSEASARQSGTEAIISQAFSRLPEPAGVDFNLDESVYDAASKQLEISALLPQFRPSGVAPELFVAGPAGFAFAPPKLAYQDGRSVRWTVAVEGMPRTAEAGKSETLEIVVTLGQRAIEQSIQVEGFARD